MIEGVRIEQSMRLRPVPESAGAARRMVAACLAGRGQVSAVEDAVLLASEVVTNAVVHGGPHGPAAQVLLRVDSTDARVRIEVHDEGAGFPTVGDGAAGRPSGRGMILVDLLSSGWGVIVSGTGKLVWFEIES